MADGVRVAYRLLPDYFKNHGDAFHFAVGDRVYGSLILQPSQLKVIYSFSDGSQVYEDSRVFPSISAAVRFTKRFAVVMRRASGRNSVPHLGTFREF